MQGVCRTAGAAGRESGQPVATGEGARFGAGVKVEFAVDVGEVAGGGPWVDGQRLADLAVGPTAGHQTEHLDLSLGEIGRRGHDRARGGRRG